MANDKFNVALVSSEINQEGEIVKLEEEEEQTQLMVVKVLQQQKEASKIPLVTFII
jgi:hypothetical protein